MKKVTINVIARQILLMFAVLLLYITLKLISHNISHRIGVCILFLCISEAIIAYFNWSKIARNFDTYISSSTIKMLFGVAIAIICWFIIGLGIIYYLDIPTSDPNMTKEGFTYMLISDPGTILDSFKDKDTPTSLIPFLCVISIIGFILVCGIMISVFSNFFQRRVDDYKNGVTRYKHLKNHIVIIGFDEIVPSLVRQKCNECDKEGANSSILILSKKNSKEVREHINSMLKKEEEKRIIIYCGRRDSKDELKNLNLKEAKEIFILGNRQNEGHDALNIDCLVKMKDAIGKWKEGKKKIPVTVMFDNYATFTAFQVSDLSKEWRESFRFKPFNFYDYWAQKVIIDHGYDGTNDVKNIYYPRIEGNKPIKGTDNVVNVIIFGITSMGVAIATQAAHYLHFSRKTDGSIRKSRITFICTNAKEEMDMFYSFYSHFFEIQSSIYRDFTNIIGSEEIILPTYFKNEDANFLDIEFEFINGESYHPKVRDYLRKLANDPNRRISIFITTGDDRRDINIGMSLPEEIYPEEIDSSKVDSEKENEKENQAKDKGNKKRNIIPIFVHQKTSGELLNLLQITSSNPKTNSKRKYSAIYPFGMIDTILDPNDKNLLRAQLLNLSYSKDGLNMKNDKEKEKTKEKAKEKWDEIGPALQWSNRYCANSFELKLKEFKPQKEQELEQTEDKLREINVCINDPNNLKELCEIEQNRWNVEKLLMGFRKPHEDEQTIINQNRKIKFNEYKKKFIHDLIRPYDQVKTITWNDLTADEQSVLTNEEIPTINKEMILSIPNIESLVSEDEGKKRQ